jgi:hypothetical protein
LFGDEPEADSFPYVSEPIGNSTSRVDGGSGTRVSRVVGLGTYPGINGDGAEDADSTSIEESIDVKEPGASAASS